MKIIANRCFAIILTFVMLFFAHLLYLLFLRLRAFFACILSGMFSAPLNRDFL